MIRSRPRQPADGGNMTVMMLAGLGVVGTVTAIALAIGVVTQARHRADAAADAAALAAASSAIDGTTAACDRGRELAARNGAELTRCTVVDGIADVTVSVRAPGVLAAFGSTTGRARAGPVGAGTD